MQLRSADTQLADPAAFGSHVSAERKSLHQASRNALSHLNAEL
jgi:hypothetical protein